LYLQYVYFVKGLLTLEEPKVSVITRASDRNIVKEVMNAAGAEYTQKSGKKVELELDTTVTLPPGPKETASNEEYW
jgi:hypothetical protein